MCDLCSLVGTGIDNYRGAPAYIRVYMLEHFPKFQKNVYMLVPVFLKVFPLPPKFSPKFFAALRAEFFFSKTVRNQCFSYVFVLLARRRRKCLVFFTALLIFSPFRKRISTIIYPKFFPLPPIFFFYPQTFSSNVTPKLKKMG